MPHKNPGESKKSFIARCISSEESKKTFPDLDQRIAFCYSRYKSDTAKSDLIESSSNSNMEKKAYDLCPICGGFGIERERRIDGNTICENGHKYLSKNGIKYDL